MNKTANGVNIYLEDKKKSRQFFVFIWFLYAVVFMTKNCYNGAMASIVADGVLTKAQTGFITAAFYIVYTPLQILGGVFSDRFSPERMIKLGLIGGAISNFVIFLNHSYYVMLLAWVFNALAQFGIWPAVFKIISSQLVKSDRKRMVFYISFAGTGGLLLSYFIAAIVPAWEYNFAVSAIVLLIFSVALHMFEKYLTPYFKYEKKEEARNYKTENKKEISSFRLFMSSGFVFFFISTILAVVVSQSRVTLTPIMFVENYNNVSASVGNLLNIFMIISGLIGPLVANKLVSEGRNEVKIICVIYLCMLPFLFMCRFIGSIAIPLVIGILCVIAAFESVIGVFRSYYNLSFAKYGKNGTAAGLTNAGTSFSYVIAAYVMPKVVESSGWDTLVRLWPVLIITGFLILAISIPMFKKFKEADFK